MKVTFFENFSSNRGDIALEQFLRGIADGRSATQVNAIRQALAEGDSEKAERLKKALPAYTLSATYRGARRADSLTGYNRVIVLDIDKLDPGAVEPLKKRIEAIEYTLSCFRSCSAVGLKVICRPFCSHPLTVANHRATFQQMAAAYEQQLGIRVDPSGKDVGRLCFDSYDPDIYIHPQLGQWIEQLQTLPEIPEATGEALQEHAPDLLKMPHKAITNKLSSSRRQTNRVTAYETGNRNNYIYIFSHYCRRKNLQQQEVIAYCRKHFTDLDAKEIQQAVESAYNTPQQENEKKKKPDKNTPLQEIEKYLNEHFTFRHNTINQRLEVKKRKSKKNFEVINATMLNTLWCEMTKAGISCQFATFRILLYSHFVPEYNPFEQYF